MNFMNVATGRLRKRAALLYANVARIISVAGPNYKATLHLEHAELRHLFHRRAPVCVCVCERERERECACVRVRVRVCVHVRVRRRRAR